MKTKKAIVMFSGGIDSTLATALISKKYDEIHLLTFHQQTSFQVNKSKYHLTGLKKVFGNKFKHKIINIGKEYREILSNNLMQDIGKFHLHMSLFLCEACRIAMQAVTIQYALKNKITEIYDGAWIKQNTSPEAMLEYVKESRKFYKKYDLKHFSPVYDYKSKQDIQKKLFELGVVDSPKYKCKPLMNTDAYLFPKNQASCPLGKFSIAYSKFIYAPIFGDKKRNLDCVKYFKRKIKLVKTIIQRNK